MRKDYIAKIKANISIYASKKTANILDGSYKSIYKGKSLDFDELREYNIGDDIKDIDWKSSSRSGTVLVRKYIAEKKHNILLVLDTESKMLADSRDVIPKSEIALMTSGIISYIANQHGDTVGAIYNKNSTISYFSFRTGMSNIQRILYNYEKDIGDNNTLQIDDTLLYVANHLKKRKIIFVITDIDGIEKISEDTLKRVSAFNDVLFINISDAYMFGDNGYDMQRRSYIPSIFSKDQRLFKEEKLIREKLYLKCNEKLKKYKISMITIDNDKEIVRKVIDLLERHKYANNS